LAVSDWLKGVQRKVASGMPHSKALRAITETAHLPQYFASGKMTIYSSGNIIVRHLILFQCLP
jgi:hypothetical protein